MDYSIPLLAALAVAIFNGLAAVLQKVSADKHSRVTSFKSTVLFSLLKKGPYLLGSLLDLAAGGLTLLAAHSLPLFLVQALIATSVVFTALFEWAFFHKRITAKKLVAMLVVIAGLALVALATTPHHAKPISETVKTVFILSPLVCLLVGGWALRSKSAVASFSLGALSGVAFGAASILGRVLVYPHPAWHVMANPLVWVLVLYAVLGLFFFTIGLQRASATSVNATMVGFQTVVPTLVGIWLLGDSAKSGLWGFVALGTILVLAGCLYIALGSQR